MKRIFLLFLVSLLLLPLLTFANGGSCEVTCPPGEFCIPNPLKACNIKALIDAIIDFIFYVAIVVAPVMIIIAAFLFVTSAGNTEQVSRARRLITYALVGLVLIYLSRILFQVIRDVLGVD